MDLRQKSVSARIYRLLLDAAERHGLDRAELTRQIGIDEVDLAAPDARVPGDKHLAMLRVASRCFGRGEAPPGDVSQLLLPFPELAGVVCNSPTLRDALRRFIAYRDLIGNVDWLVAHEDADRMAFDYVLEGEERDASSALGNFALLTSIARMYDPDMAVREVGVTDPDDVTGAAFDPVFGLHVKTRQGSNRLVLDSEVLDRPFEVFNAPLATIHLFAADRMQQQIRARAMFAPTVERCLRDVLREHIDAIESRSLQALVCERLSLTRWTLQRKLAAEQVTFSDVLAQTRVQEARDLLAHTQMPISEISERVGFGSTTAFTRFFTRACGAPPAKYRDRQRGVDVMPAR
ncbi:AraC family transcriptional regulator [Pararobbsia alpina]|uniref:helix-turn-helix transcriptional regulator n=1 Tax=Pararobbsia alpina TaxID=621374 RepID=UPI0039A7110C